MSDQNENELFQELSEGDGTGVWILFSVDAQGRETAHSAMDLMTSGDEMHAHVNQLNFTRQIGEDGYIARWIKFSHAIR